MKKFKELKKLVVIFWIAILVSIPIFYIFTYALAIALQILHLKTKDELILGGGDVVKYTVWSVSFIYAFILVYYRKIIKEMIVVLCIFIAFIVLYIVAQIFLFGVKV